MLIQVWSCPPQENYVPVAQSQGYWIWGGVEPKIYILYPEFFKLLLKFWLYLFAK